MLNIADSKRLGYVGKVTGRDSDSWFTPFTYIKAVNEVLGGIDLDPFSSQEANTIVGARRFFTERDNAFEKDWGKQRTVFMNPPYGVGICGKAVDRFIRQFKMGAFSEAIVLVNNATETKWFQLLSGVSDAICFPNLRIAFYNVDGKRKSGNTRGQTFFYIGKHRKVFKRVFGKIGVVF